MRAGALIAGLTIALLAMAAAPRLFADHHHPYLDAKTGYRMGHYRAALPARAPGSVRLNIKQLRDKIAKKQVALIDVAAHVGAGYNPITGEWFVQKKRYNIPGSIWIPDVGAGYLTPVMARYFRETLEKATGGDRTRGVVLYCTSDCWMSWNAVKRASGWGYNNLYWFPEGSDGWREAGFELAEAKPAPVRVGE